ncbi:MAG: DUF615 domain-containing protein [Kistimonas sp.]|nr:DUF615 domain-containing protein [Kistimonas sp.]
MTPHSQEDPVRTLPSKSDHKRAAASIRELGVALGALSPTQRAQLPLNDSIRSALDELDRIKNGNARQRQLGFIGRLLRAQEEHIDAIRQCMDLIQPGSPGWQRHRQQTEVWQQRLLQEGKEGQEAFNTFCQNFAHTDPQTLRQLVRNRLREQSDAKKAARSKKLLRYIHEVRLAQQTAQFVSTAHSLAAPTGEQTNDV